MSAGLARRPAVARPATGKAHASPPVRCQAVADLEGLLGVAARAVDLERKPKRRQLAEGAKWHRLQSEARHPLIRRLRGLGQRFTRYSGIGD
jgi:hypothetical protein